MNNTLTLAIDGGCATITKSRPHEVWPRITQATIDAVGAYLLEGKPISIADGSGIIKDLEQTICDYLNVQYALTANSGSNALHSAYVALDLPAGSEVIAPVLTFHASITPAIHCGLTPVLVDIQADTGNISPEAIREAISPKTRCVVINHTWGHPVDMDEIVEICQQYNLRLIEDCSHAYGSTYKGQRVGSFGDIAVFSMQASKMVPAGEGGFLVTNNRTYYERACLIGHYRGRSLRDVLDPELRPFAETGFGLKYRIHPLAALIARHEFSLLNERIESRNTLMSKLSEGIKNSLGIKPPFIRPYVTMGSFFGYKPKFIPGQLYRHGNPISCDEYISILTAEGLDIHRPSVLPLHKMKMFQCERVPLSFAQHTWKPRLCGPFTGCDDYFGNRLSLPTFTDKESLPLVHDYTKALIKVSNYLSS